MDPLKFPITSIELAFIANMITVLLYVGISLLTCKTPFNMDRLLHRGVYRAKGEVEAIPERLTAKTFFLRRILGIDHQYTRGDRILAWSVFLCHVECAERVERMHAECDAHDGKSVLWVLDHHGFR